MTPGFTSTPSPLAVERPRSRSLVSLTPLIDVVFILLVFFMLASSFLDWRAIELAAPQSGTTASSAEGALLVEVRADGTLRLSGEALDMGALASRVSRRLAQRPDQAIVLEPQAGVALQAAVDVLDRLVALGAKDVSLIRDSPQ